MEGLVNLLGLTFLVPVIFILLIVFQYRIFRKHTCEDCGGHGVVSSCCGGKVATISDAERSRIYKVCHECGSVCGLYDCEGEIHK